MLELAQTSLRELTVNLSGILQSGCVTLICNKKYVALFLTQSFYPSSGRDQGVFRYVNQVTFGMPPGHLRTGAGSQKKQPHDWRLEFSVQPLPSFYPWGGKRGAEG